MLKRVIFYFCKISLNNKKNMKNTILITAVLFGLLITSCKNRDTAAVANQEKLETIDSMKIVLEKQKVIDSMTTEAAKVKEKQQQVVVTRTVESPRNSSSSSTTTTTTTTRKKGWSRAAKGAVIGAGVGAATGAIISKNKTEGAIIGGLAGAGVGAGTGAILDGAKNDR